MLLERRKNPLRRFTQNSLKGRERSISYIYCERLNRLLRNPNDLTTTTGVRRGKSKDGTLSKRLEKPHSHPNLDLPLLASLKKVGCWEIFQVSLALAIALNFRLKGVTRYKFERLSTHSSGAERVGRGRWYAWIGSLIHSVIAPTSRSIPKLQHYPCSYGATGSLSAESKVA